MRTIFSELLPNSLIRRPQILDTPSSLFLSSFNSPVKRSTLLLFYTRDRSRLFSQTSAPSMYLRDVHADLDQPSLHTFIQGNPLGVLTTAIKSPSFPTIQSSHIPWVLDVQPLPSDSEAPVGTLRGHLARANPQTKAILAAATKESGNGGKTLEDEVLILFTSPVTHYITPKFYVETKPATGKVVPTWNYAAVQAYGSLTVHADSKSEFLDQQIRDLTKGCEEGLMGYDGKEGRQGAWTVDDAPEKFSDLLKKAIVGVEIKVSRLEGKWKMSQESTVADRRGVVEGFEKLGGEAGKVGELVRARGEKREREKRGCPA